MKPNLMILIAGIIMSLTALALGCGGPTATAIYPMAATTVTVIEPTMTVPITTYPADVGLMPGDLYVIIGGGYADSVTEIGVGQKFEWVNYDHEAHTITATGEYAGLFDFTLQPGQAVEYSFANPDTYQYYDKLHMGESATVVVDAGGD